MGYTVGSGSGVKRKVYFDCPRCASPVDSTLEYAGQKRPCPICGREMEVPGVAEVKIMRAEEAAKEARRIEEQRAREERAAAAAKERAEREAAEEAAAEQARAERREKRKRSEERRRAAAAAAPSPAPAPAAAPVPTRGKAAAGAPAGAAIAADADPFAGVEFAEAPAAPQSSRMSRRRRRFAGFLAGIAALLLCAVAALWWQSERVETRVEWGRRTPDRSVAQALHSTRGAISYERRTYVRDDARQTPASFAPARSERPATTSRLDEPGWTERHRSIGFGVYSDLSGRREREGKLYHWELIVPYWALCAVLAVPVLFSIARRVRGGKRSKVGTRSPS